MQRLSGMDAGFLHMETPSMHLHTLKIGIVDPSTVPGGYRFEEFRQVLSDRLHLLPPFRQTVVEIPFGLHHPVWVEDADFAIDDHLVRVAVPAPGTMREVDELIGHIASRPLDRSRPLWEMWIIEGLADGRVAFVTKVHHAAADGVAASAMLANIMSVGPELAPVDPPPFRGEARPSNAMLVARAFADHVPQFFRLGALLRRTWLAVRAIMAMRKGEELDTPRPVLDAPMASFNGALTSQRTFATASLPLADFRTVKAVFGVTLNDVVLAVVSGALRRHLDRNGEKLDRSLTCSVPVGVDGPEDGPRLIGNRVSNLFTTLATDLDDPIARLHRINRVTTDAKRMQEALGKDFMESWIEYTPPPLLKAFVKLYTRYRFADRHRPPQNLVVSNVPGPREPLHVAGARLTDLYSVGPIMEGMGLNVTVWSYVDRMNFSALACRNRLPKLHLVVDDFAVALAELVDLAAGADRGTTSAGAPPGS